MMLAEELAKAGIRLRSMRQGDHKTLCPQCSATRKNKTDPCLSVTVDDAGGAVWMCHNCQWAGNVPGEFKRDETRRHRPVQPVKPIPVADPKRPDAMYKWFAGRGIGARVVDKFGIHRVERGGVGFLVFPYYWRGELVNNKYRSADKQFRQDKDAERTIYNIDAVKDSDTIIWVEGEMDVLALDECGVFNAVSLPDGAPSSVGGGDKRYEALGNCKNALAGKKYVLAGDMDSPGLAHREELARRLGKVNCSVASWPEGCKDANETLINHGPDKVIECLNEAKPYPIEGLYEVNDYVDGVLDLYEHGRKPGLSTGWTSLDEFYTVKELDLCIVLGIPNNGKSNFMDALAVNMARLHGWKFGVCSFETMPVEHISTIAEKIAGKPFSDGFTPKMDPAELRKALEFAQQHFFFIRGDEIQPTVDFILERAADAVLRYGIKGLIIDPYNEIEHARGDKNETEYVSDFLSKLRRFNRSHGVTTWLICHPTKLKKDDNGTIPPPTLYDAMGSSHFNNKADSSFTVHRPDFNSPLTHIYIRKIRHRWTGKPSPTPVKLRFIGISGDYSDDLQGL